MFRLNVRDDYDDLEVNVTKLPLIITRARLQHFTSLYKERHL